VIDPAPFRGLRLPGGFVLTEIEFTSEPLVDALGRSALAKTRIVGHEIHVRIVLSQDATELSVSLYHEILEAMTVASARPPSAVEDYNEADFDRAAYAAHTEFGTASPVNLNRMLQTYGFGQE
jgi:hypothetical protein